MFSRWPAFLGLGTAGVVYAGLADVETPKALQNDRLALLLRVIDSLSAQDELPHDKIGRAWLLRDVILHGSGSHHRQDPEHQVKRWPVPTRSPGRAFGALGVVQLQQLAEQMSAYRIPNNQRDHVEIWRGLRSCLVRQLSKIGGAGRHPYFYRPLFDPCQAIMDRTAGNAWKCRDRHRVQLVGEEFLSINYHVPEWIDIATMRLYWAVECESPAELWRIDRTNPGGEKLLEGSAELKALKIVVDDATVPSDLLPTLYNSLRRREYFWNWYSANKISRHEIVDFLTERSQPFRGQYDSLLRRPD